MTPQKESKEAELDRRLSSFLVEKKCPTTLGYYYLKSCIVKTCLNPSVTACMNKLLYEKISTEHDTDVANVERCIRNVINIWWKTLKNDILFTKKPTNKECIITLAEYINSRQDDKPKDNDKTFHDDERYISIYEQLFG